MAGVCSGIAGRGQSAPSLVPPDGEGKARVATQFQWDGSHRTTPRTLPCLVLVSYPLAATVSYSAV